MLSLFLILKLSPLTCVRGNLHTKEKSYLGLCRCLPNLRYPAKFSRSSKVNRKRICNFLYSH